MIYLQKGATNSVVMTLTEKSELNNPYFLFSFTNNTSGDEKLFNMVDISGYRRRYNRFELVETSSEDLPNGRVELEYGWGRYEVYESATQSLDINDTTGKILEEGKFYVSGYPATLNNNDINNIYL